MAESGRVRKVVIAGGGTAGWVTAMAMSQQMKELLDITLVESEAVGTIGVGEATIPTMPTFHKLTRVDELSFIRATEATFKLGIRFENWGDVGESYFHSFGQTGKETWMATFLHFWLRAKDLGLTDEYGEFCKEWVAAQQGKFAKGQNVELSYAYHLDAGLYAKFLRELSEKNGVKRIEGKIQSVTQDPDNGFIKSLELDNGKSVEGDLFIDCTGFKGLLIEETLNTGYEAWDEWLICDSAVAMQTTSIEPAQPFTRAIAHESGWRWRIPLQHRMGNGLVYSSQHMSDDEAIAKLKTDVDGDPLTEPRVIKFKPGKRKLNWNKNCVAIGLSSGFLEPLESTSIHLFMNAATRLMQLFPFDGITKTIVDEYNSEAAIELESIRDFIILHYKATRREDSPFWQHCKNMAIPDSLAHRIALFEEHAQVFQKGKEIFRVDSWNQVMLGQGLKPKHYHRFVDIMAESDLRKFVDSFNTNIGSEVRQYPAHADFIKKYCSKD